MTTHIQIRNVPPRIQYVADGTQTTFEFPFVVFNENNIKVYFNDTVQNANTYTVAYDNDGGSVTFATAPTADTIVTIFRDLAIERTTDFQEGGALRANVLNDELDYQIACQQQIADELNRSMVLPPYASGANVDLILPCPKAGKAIVWNSDGTNLENSTVEINALESTLKDYRDVAEAEAALACEKAADASNKADAASASAQQAAAKAREVAAAVEGFSHSHSNCVKSIPQDINLTLENGTLTLRSGSIVTYADGSQYQLTSDKTRSSGGSGDMLIVYRKDNVLFDMPITSCFSGSTQPTDVTSAIWYDTTNNIVKYTSDSFSTYTECSFPIAKATFSGGVPVSIDQVFNGAGYIGHHAFVLPGVKGLCPAGLNDDGSLKSINFMMTVLSVIELATNITVIGTKNNRIGAEGWSKYTEIDTKDGYNITAGERAYVRSENTLYLNNFSPTQIRSLSPLVFCGYDGASVTQFDIQPVVRLVTDSDVVKLSGNQTISGEKTFTGTVIVPTPAAGDNSEQIANTEWVLSNTGPTPRDITELADGNGSLLNTDGYLNLSESWQNFEEIVIVGSSSTTGNKLTAFRTSTYFLDVMLQETGNPLVWSNMGDGYLTVANYSATTNPSTTSDLYVNGHAYCYLRKVYGVNRKAA